MPKIGVGLDIGTSSVKVLELQADNNGEISLNQFGIMPLPDAALNGGVVNDAGVVSAAVKDLFMQTKVKSNRIVVAIAGQAVIVRNIKTPLMTDAEVANAIKWEAERYIPFPIDEVNMDFHVIHRDKEQDEMEVMLVCAHNDIIKSHLETLKQVEIFPHIMDIQPFALIRTFGMENQPKKGSIALLDIGAGTSDLTILKDGIPRFTRIIPVAGRKFTEMISKGLDISYAEAEKAKIDLSDALYDSPQEASADLAYNVNFAISEGFKELALELRRSFDYYQLQQRNEAISKLIISGGGSTIKNLTPYLNGQLNMTVEIGGPAFKVNCSNQTREGFEANFPKLAVAFGLALREVTTV